MKKALYILSLTLSIFSMSQSDSISTSTIDSSRYITFSTEEENKLDLTTKKKVEKELKKKKVKKKVFYGYKTRRGFTFKNKGVHQILEIFFYLKKWEEPNTFVKNIFWYDPVKRKIIKSHKYDPATSKLLHGPYVKKIDNEIVEQGVYYKGVKHARWEKWSIKKPLKIKKMVFTEYDTTEKIIEVPQKLLVEKKKYNRGWPKNAEITYFDPFKKKYKEITPYDDEGYLNGDYYRFFENGKIAEYGRYAYGYKIGKWVSYHPGSGKYQFKDKILAYPKLPFYDNNTEPFLVGSWNNKGTQLEDNSKEYNNLLKKEIQKRQKR